MRVCTEQYKARKGFRKLMGELMRVGIYYDDYIERKNNSDNISGLVSEKERNISTTPTRLS